MLTMTDVGVRVIELRERDRRRNLPTVLGRHIKERAWPLRHLDFTIEGGQTVYVVDLATHRPALFLRLATGLLRPDEGTVSLPPRSLLATPVNRKVTRSLSVGQAIRLISGTYGMSDKAIDRRFDDIAEFAGVTKILHKVCDTQSRSTMAQVSFAAATSAPVDLIAFDRSAIVGDPEFRPKCFARLAELKASGKGLIVYSTDPRQVRKVADRGLVLDGGATRELTPAEFAQLLIDEKAEKTGKGRKGRRRKRDHDPDDDDL